MSDFEMRYVIVPELKVVVTKTKGNVVIKSMLNKFKDLTKDPLFNPDTHYFHDFRGVSSFEGRLSDHESMAEFAITIPSKDHFNVIFLVPEDSLSIKKYLEGYALMASESNRHYWVFQESELDEALKKVGLKGLPDLDAL